MKLIYLRISSFIILYITYLKSKHINAVFEFIIFNSIYGIISVLLVIIDNHKVIIYKKKKKKKYIKIFLFLINIQTILWKIMNTINDDDIELIYFFIFI